MKILIAGGTGFVGRYLTAELLKCNDSVTILGRSKNKIKKIYHDTVTALTWNELSQHELREYDALINLAGENLSDKRWTEDVKQTIIESRIHSTQALASLCAPLGPHSPRILSASAVGIYGATGDHANQPLPVDELWPIPENYTPNFLSHVAQQWEKSLTSAIEKKVPVTIMRFGIIIKENEGMLKKLLPSIKLGLGATLGNGQQWMSWISIHDLVTAIIFLLQHPDIHGAMNLTHPLPVTQVEFIHKLAKHYHRPCFLKLPEGLVNLLFGQMGRELLLNGQKVVPTRLLDYHFKFSNKAIENAFL